MEKKGSNGTLTTVLTVLGVGAGALVVYKIFSPSSPAAPVKVPAKVPAAGPTASAAPAAAPGTLPTVPISRGPAYQKWAAAIQQVNQDYLSGKIGFPASQAKLNDMRLAINQDYVNNQLTSNDLDDLSSDIATYGG
jgi:hypothetical protein